jgi:hypothetical protein
MGNEWTLDNSAKNLDGIAGIIDIAGIGIAGAIRYHNRFISGSNFD